MKDFLKKTIIEAGELALEWFHNPDSLGIRNKGEYKDLVSEADIAVEKFLRSKTKSNYPDFGFYGEEEGITKGEEGRWIVDPIDGTLSFSRGQHYWTISIAIEMCGEIRMAAVYAPAMNLLYFAEKGEGAFRNNEPIQVSNTNRIEEAVLSTGFACIRSNIKPNNLSRFNRMLEKAKAVWIRGSAALDLCTVAEGMIDAFWEQYLNLYDVAAGALIVEEAGGTITDFNGKTTLNPRQMLACNKKILPSLIPIMPD